MAKFEFLKAGKTPDFEELKKVIRGEKKAEKVHFVELLMDYEIKKVVTEQYLGEKWIEPADNNKANYIKQDRRLSIILCLETGVEHLPDGMEVPPVGGQVALVRI